MDVTLVALNAKYIHDSLAVRLLQKSAPVRVDLYESNINVPAQTHYRKLFAQAPSGAVLGFSTYIWNVELVQWLCSVLKKTRPDVTLLLGGPECTGDAGRLLDASGAHFAISGEGEAAFGVFLEYLQDGRDLSGVPGLWYRSGGEWKHNPEAETPMEALPLAYDEDLSGRIAYYESSRGCPFHCAFCMSAGVRLRYHSAERALDELSRLVGMGAKQVKLVDRTFNALPERAREIWSALICDFGEKRINFHFEIAAQLLTREDFALLEQAPEGLFQFEIGIQSTNKQTLEAINRSASLEAIFSAVKRLVSMGNIHVHVDLIAGLPHEGFERFGRTFDDAFALIAKEFEPARGFDNAPALQLGFLKLLPGSALREKADELGLVYDEKPPYTVLETCALPAAQLIRLQRLERAFVRTWNERFRTTMSRLLKSFESPFSLFAALGDAWELPPESPAQVLSALYDFARENGLLSPLLLDCMKFDLLKWERCWKLPEFLPEMSAENKLIAKERLERAVREIPRTNKPYSRNAQLELFSFDVTGDFSPTPNWVLFSYSPERACKKLGFPLFLGNPDGVLI